MAICFCAKAIISGVSMLGSIVLVGRARAWSLLPRCLFFRRCVAQGRPPRRSRAAGPEVPPRVVLELSRPRVKTCPVTEPERKEYSDLK